MTIRTTRKVVSPIAFSNQQPDIVVRPDSGTLTAAECRPEGSGLLAHFRQADAVDYTEGEMAL